jgi:aspartate racemase
MKQVGLVGGIGPESTVDYYRRILSECGRRRPGPAPHLTIHSISAATLLNYAQHDHAALTAYLLKAVHLLNRAGAEAAAFCSNTPHLVFDALMRESPVPLLGIVDKVAAVASRHGFKRLGLLGTGFTMGAQFYPEALKAVGVQLITPLPDEQTILHERYVGELAGGMFTTATRRQFATVIERLVSEDNVDAVVLGGTELPILLESYSHAPVPLLNSAAIHVDSIVDYILDERVDQP